MKKIGNVPTGIFILSAILFLMGFNQLLAAAFAVFFSVPLTILHLIIGAFSIICASKLIKLQYQGWQLAMIASGLYLLIALVRVALSANLNAGINSAIIDVIIPVLIVIYLSRPGIKNIFRE